jgi:hypothetical protein
MTGARLIRLGRRLLHHDTFELFVAPAIADLQYAPPPAAHTAAWRSLAGALREDLAGDLRFLVTGDLGLMLGLIAMQSCYYGGMLLLLVAHMRTVDALDQLAHGGAPRLLATVLSLIGASAVPTLLCFWPPRRTADI